MDKRTEIDGEGVRLPELKIRDIVRTRASIRMKHSYHGGK